MIEQAADGPAAARFVDLTRTLTAGMPVPEGLPVPERVDLYDGAVQKWTLVGQTGTHIDSPGHFHRGMALIDDIPVEDFVLPGCVIDMSMRAAADHDCRLMLEDVLEWEGAHGPIPQQSIVLLRTDWSKRWPDPAAFFNRDAAGVNHYPGWSREALEYLVEVRYIKAIGHETPDTDSGATATAGPVPWPLESYFLGTGRWQVENLAHLDCLPARGFRVVVGVAKIGAGASFPARVFAMVPFAMVP